MDNKIQKLEDKIQEQNRLIGVLTRQNKEKDREIGLNEAQPLFFDFGPFGEGFVWQFRLLRFGKGGIRKHKEAPARAGCQPAL